MGEAALKQDTPDITQKITPSIEEARKLVVNTPVALERANELRKVFKGLIKEVTDTFGPIKKKTHEAWKESVAQEKRHLDPLEQADKALSQAMGQFMLEEERKRKEESERAEAAARKEREKALDKVNKKIDELLTKSGDVQGKIDALNAELYKTDITDIEAAAIRGRIEVLMARKAALGSNIEAKAAQVAETEAAYMVAPASTDKPKAPAGMGFRTTRVAEVINKMALVKAVAEGRVPLDVLEIHAGNLNRLANAGAILPGCSVKTKPIVNTRA